MTLLNSLNGFCRFLAIILMAGFSSTALCESVDIYQQGNSTAVIKQSSSGSNGGSSRAAKNKETKITKTPQGQKIITRSGNNTDTTIQDNSNSNSNSNSADRFTRGSREIPDCTIDSSCNRTYDAPTEDEFKERINRRMRPI